MVQTYSLQAVMAGYPSGSYICHHGIKGQKWGIRRFQNEDGSLTPEGERRYRHYMAKYHTKVGGVKEFDTDKSKRQAKVVREAATSAGITGSAIGGALGGPLVAAGILSATAVIHIINKKIGAIKREKARDFMMESGKLTDENLRKVKVSRLFDDNPRARKQLKAEEKAASAEEKALRVEKVNGATLDDLKNTKTSLSILSDGRALRDLSKEVYGGQFGAYSKLMAATSYVDEYKTALYKKYKGNKEATAELERIYGKPGDNTKIMRDLMKKEPRLKNAYRDYPEDLRQIMRIA